MPALLKRRRVSSTVTEFEFSILVPDFSSDGQLRTRIATLVLRGHPYEIKAMFKLASESQRRRWKNVAPDQQPPHEAWTAPRSRNGGT